MLKELDFSFSGVISTDDFGPVEMQHLIADLLQMSEGLLSQDTFIFQTSGSTGEPKSISFNRHEIVSSAKLTADFFRLEKGAKVLLALPVRYVAGRMMLYRSVINQWKLYVAMPSLNPLTDLDIAIEFAALTPQQLAVIIEQTPEKLSLIQTIICGGGKLDRVLNEKILELGIAVFETYGMTETLTHVAVRALHHGETTFHALPGVTFSLNENQCLVIECGHLSGAPIITQDIVELISPVEMRWIGRNDFVVNSGGIKIYPERVEAILSQVFDFSFYIGGVSDELLGQRLVIFVEEIPTGFNWQEMLNETELTKYERPREMIAIGKFERTESGKLIRKK